MRVVVTGGAGFLGRRLAVALLARGVESVVLVDVVDPVLDDPRVRAVVGDVAERVGEIGPVDAVFHLAAVVSGQAEAEFDLGMRVNLDASRAVLEACRAAGNRPRVVFTSSVAVYGGERFVTDATALRPETSYGIQKACAELLLADYTRKGFVDGLALRLPTVSVRAGAPNRAASSFASGIIREPLAGVECVCPVAPDTRLWLLSPRRAVECLVAGLDLDGGTAPVNLPGVSVTVGEMVDALGRVAGPGVAALVRFAPDPEIQRIASGWPGGWDTTRAEARGLRGDADADEIIRTYVEERG